MAEETNGEQGAEPKVDAKAEVKGAITQLEAALDEYMVKKAPFAIPAGIKEFLATVAPYLIILSAIFAVPALLAVFGMGAVYAPFSMMGYGYGWGSHMMISLAVMAVTVVLEVMAIPGLFKRTKASWNLLFYASLVQVVGSVLAFNLIGAVIGAVISWYILFQMKDVYKN